LFSCSGSVDENLIRRADEPFSDELKLLFELAASLCSEIFSVLFSEGVVLSSIACSNSKLLSSLFGRAD